MAISMSATNPLSPPRMASLTRFCPTPPITSRMGAHQQQRAADQGQTAADQHGEPVAAIGRLPSRTGAAWGASGVAWGASAVAWGASAVAWGASGWTAAASWTRDRLRGVAGSNGGRLLGGDRRRRCGRRLDRCGWLDGNRLGGQLDRRAGLPPAAPPAAGAAAEVSE
jgi:hypothetical protein